MPSDCRSRMQDVFTSFTLTLQILTVTEVTVLLSNLWPVSNFTQVLLLVEEPVQDHTLQLAVFSPHGLQILNHSSIYPAFMVFMVFKKSTCEGFCLFGLVWVGFLVWFDLSFCLFCLDNPLILAYLVFIHFCGIEREIGGDQSVLPKEEMLKQSLGGWTGRRSVDWSGVGEDTCALTLHDAC